MTSYHVHVRAASRFADYYLRATSWEDACRKALAAFKSELPKGAKSLASWATCSC